ncbi:MAG: hypothetical protein ACK5N0_04550 [Synechococcaceae cyanobacterium]
MGWGVSRGMGKADGSPLSPQEAVERIALAAQKALVSLRNSVPRGPLEVPWLQRPGLARAWGPDPPRPPADGVNGRLTTPAVGLGCRQRPGRRRL